MTPCGVLPTIGQFEIFTPTSKELTTMADLSDRLEWKLTLMVMPEGQLYDFSVAINTTFLMH
jgi:hypothetical protein